MRPLTRGDCANIPRPCEWTECRFHTGRTDIDSCALDVADEGGATLERVGGVLGITRERARQIEFKALRKLEQAGLIRTLRTEETC